MTESWKELPSGFSSRFYFTAVI